MRKPPPSTPIKNAAKQRADLALVRQGLADGEDKARALIMSGAVYAENRRIDKPSESIGAKEILRVKGKAHDYVSRGALKLVAALDHFNIGPMGKICLDVGASTGGFTEALLRRGAAKVYAVDSGTNQLDWKLRSDPRVIVHERCNARALDRAIIPEAPQIIVADVSFISLTVALPAALGLAASDAQFVALIKPQFEATREDVGDGGIVRDEAVRQAACDKIQAWLERDMKWAILGLIESPITGHDGNKEYLIAATRGIS
ncbi:MAG: TlyA family RNA methyltransferase [Alphaproteobacteria bacterium]